MNSEKMQIHPFMLLFLILLLLTDRGGVALVTLLAAFLHECGHMIMAKALGISWKRLRLDLFGARLELGPQVLSYSEEWLLAAAGPIVSLLLSLLAVPFWNHTHCAFMFSCASLLLGLLNLLPIRTFDGGRMLETFLLSKCSVRFTFQIMRSCSFFCLFLLWSFSIYFLLKAGDGLSLLFFSMGLFGRFFQSGEEL